MTDTISHYLAEFVEAHLPAARALQISIASYDGNQLCLKAPLAANHNDKLTAFGGSLYVVTVMTCWGMVYLRCRQQGIDPDIVVARGEIDYLAPVRDIVAQSSIVDDAEWDSFFQCFAERGRAKIQLSSQILVDGKPAVSFTGTYAIVGEKPLSEEKG